MTDRLSVLMPIYNEAEGLSRSFHEARGFLEKSGVAFEFILVDDASTDATPRIIAELAAEYSQVKTLHHRSNQGPCSGLRTGPSLATGNWLLLLPVDLSVPLDDIVRLWERRGEADILLGYLNEPARRPLARRLQSAAYTRMINGLFGMDLRQVNGIALYRTEIFHRIRLESTGVALHAEILVRARNSGFRLEQVCLGYQPRRDGVETGNRPKVILKTIIEVFKLFAALRRANDRHVGIDPRK